MKTLDLKSFRILGLFSVKKEFSGLSLFPDLLLSLPQPLQWALALFSARLIQREAKHWLDST